MKKPDSQWCGSLWDTVTGRELHEDPEVPNYGTPGRGPRLVPGMTIAIEPMICQYGPKVKTLADGWTVKTKDGGLAAHFGALGRHSA